MQHLTTWLRSFWPAAYTSSPRERLLACLGAALGLFITEWISRQALGTAEPWFIAPVGASAVLIFVLPASPLAQPWPVLGGNLVSGLIGVTCAKLLGHTGLAIALAVPLSIALMLALRCLHPPSGAVALTAILGGPAIEKLGYGFVLSPLLFDSLCMVVLALFINRLAGHSYPHQVIKTAPAAVPDLGIQRDDLHTALKQRVEMVHVSEDDLQDIIEHAAELARQRRR
jgi:CBS domain-containing membrane protein